MVYIIFKNRLLNRSNNLSGREKELLECDVDRFNFTAYQKDRLYDFNLGHWDLWNEQESEGKDIYKTKEGFIARNPLLDVKDTYTVAIDFGTKSTIVVYQGMSDDKIPMRIGTSNINSEIEDKHFENPTFMEFIDIQSFIQSFNSSTGRPDTKFQDLVVSIDAKNSMFDNMSNSNTYYSYFSELKQWADGQKKHTVICDRKGHTEHLKSFEDITDDDINPVVYYAYYIGLYINNMYRGICIDYILSYPVTYEKNICEKIRKSFEIGLKKSLPKAVVENEEIMSRFRVSLTASEPAAYAVCALQEYQIDPEDDEKILYGVFDFGGGTSDYDYGIWENEPEDDDRYDYRITRFQSVGDRYLGGENLLELLAYSVFMQNKTEVQKRNIPFVKPVSVKECPLNEVLVSETVLSRLNMFRIKESLRPFWENYSEFEIDKAEKVLKVSLYDINGSYISDADLSVDYQILDTILRNNIKNGVENFLSGLKSAISNMPSGYSLDDFKMVYIFLAGNSSRSPIVKEMFNECLSEFVKQNSERDVEDFYTILPPLGTAEADEIIKYDETQKWIKPTCKTGVAFGLLDCQSGSSIKFVSEIIGNSDENIKFKYYVGRKKKKVLLPKLTPNTKYSEWIPFISASESDFEIYYTQSPQGNDSYPIAETSRYKCRISEIDAEKTVYIRAVNSDTIEYVVSDEKNIGNVSKGLELKLI